MEITDSTSNPNRGGKEFDSKGLSSVKDSIEMINVDMNAYGVTSATHPNPILKTIGLGSCIAVALYEPNRKIAGLVHIVPPLLTSLLGKPPIKIF